MKTPNQPSKYERINVGEEDELIIEGFLPSKIRLLAFVALVLLSSGMILILIAWRPRIRVRLTHTKCSLDEAKTIVLKVSVG